MQEEVAAREVVDAAIKVHSALGPGLLESAYQTCLEYELLQRNLRVRRQVALPVHYADVVLDVGYRLDLSWRIASSSN
jgi:GxxExxY protein